MFMIELSEKLLLQVKKKQSTNELIHSLKNISFEKLLIELNSDEKKNAFWINLYNAFFLILRKERNVNKPEIYNDKLVEVAGHEFSLDDIEHGILRKYRIKILLGYVPNLFAPRLIKKLAVSKMDYRIHFALNCGAKSCPPIAFYNYEKINSQLEIATLSFLENEVTLFPKKKEAHISRLFLWYLGDFGGQGGIRKINKRNGRHEINL